MSSVSAEISSAGSRFRASGSCEGIQVMHFPLFREQEVVYGIQSVRLDGPNTGILHKK